MCISHMMHNAGDGQHISRIHLLQTSCLFFPKHDVFSPLPSEIIENVKLIHKPVSLQPRGLINKGNWCYINAVSFFSGLSSSIIWVGLMLRSWSSTSCLLFFCPLTLSFRPCRPSLRVHPCIIWWSIFHFSVRCRDPVHPHPWWITCKFYISVDQNCIVCVCSCSVRHV